jgi:hypothetical protein
MKLDKELYRWAYDKYRRWNEAEEIERARNAGRLPPEKTWEQYVALWEFLMKLSPPMSDQQRQQRWAEWDNYYARMQKIEARRHAHGKTARSSATPGGGVP